ncbi:MAG: helix-turn-helix domain-containing protein, partial [Bacilli bacterium]|nr:helix-turn-helix domain-containing protein [Bacilli bacterium]
MNYTQLTEKNKAEIDILLKQGLPMRRTASILGISHSTISRYKNNIYKKRKINIDDKYQIFINYLFSHYD